MCSPITGKFATDLDSASTVEAPSPASTGATSSTSDTSPTSATSSTSATSLTRATAEDANAPAPGSPEGRLYDQLMAVLEGPEYYEVLGVEVLLQIIVGGLTLGVLLDPFRPFPYPLFRFSLLSGKSKTGGIKKPAAADLGSRSRGTTGGTTDGMTDGTTDGSDKWLSTALQGAVATFALVIVLTLLSYATGLRGAEEGAASNSLIAKTAAGGDMGIATLIGATVIIAPIFEEVVFRGFLLTSLTKWVPTPAAVGLSAAAFALVHQQGSGDTIQLFALGLVNGLAYCKTRNLAAPILIHALFNGGVLGLFLLWTSV